MEGPTQKIFRAIVKGRVQGVLYRDFAQRKARALGLTGTVQNLRDGSIEIFAQGDEKKLKEFLEKLKRGSLFSKVESIEVAWQETDRERDDFVILY
ncbi:acylphosphatase [Candidatus Kaiserbacteria bacterium]|nr:acylphosphatase [Candidatus Kaiserbacteria bacterium]